MPLVNSQSVRNCDWQVPRNFDGTYSLDAVQTALLLDIRRELRRLNSILNCPNCLAIPRKLDQIILNTTRKRKKKARRSRR